MLSDLEKLRIANRERQAEMFEGELSISYYGNNLAGETGELCNKLKKLEREALGMSGSRATRQEAADEMADVLISLDLVALRLGVNLKEALERKFNHTSTTRKLQTRLTL